MDANGCNTLSMRLDFFVNLREILILMVTIVDFLRVGGVHERGEGCSRFNYSETPLRAPY
ncbi:MAG: hypothetical protein NPIRA04_24520 [Nitrospirales bacterium]|nr:MAG: hypothetical protein NPIRA04_24520 [Nitrospirales bacterium]